MPLYDVGIPPPAEQLGEPSGLFRVPTQSGLVQGFFGVKGPGTVVEGTHQGLGGFIFVTWGVVFFCRKSPLQSIWIPAGIPTSHRQHSNIWYARDNRTVQTSAPPSVEYHGTAMPFPRSNL